MPGCLGIIVTCTVLLYFCCYKRQIWLFFKKLFHFSTSHTYHHNSSWTIRQARNYLCRLLMWRSWVQTLVWPTPFLFFSPKKSLVFYSALFLTESLTLNGFSKILHICLIKFSTLLSNCQADIKLCKRLLVYLKNKWHF